MQETSAPNPPDQRWFVHIAEKTYGPYRQNEIKKLATEGRLIESDWLCPEGGSVWIEAKNEPTLGVLFRTKDAVRQPSVSLTAGITAQGRDQIRKSLSISNATIARDGKSRWKRSVYSTLFQSADQESIRQDLREFFGRRADKYLVIYEKMRSKNKPFVRSWNWTVFFTTFPWYFYRRMYLEGAFLVFLPPLLGYLFGIFGNAASMAGLGVTANSQYVLSALKRLQKADALGLIGAERADYLRRAGGVSITAGVLSGLLAAAMLATAIFAAYLEYKSTY
jgi:hypothetical protein